MVNFWYIKGDFTKERSKRIGASNMPALIPDPERPTESLAGYGNTPVTVWQEKTGRKKQDPAGLPAEMGNFLEAKVNELFIRAFSGYEMGLQHVHDRMAFDFMAKSQGDGGGSLYQDTPYKHHAQYYRDGMICHPDAIYDPTAYGVIPPAKVTKYGVTADMGKPFLLEAKSANYWAAKRPEGSVVRGYDTKLKTWHGIPLKHYMQIQFQLALLEVDDCYLPLIHNTSEFDIWHIKANKKHQGKLIDLAGRMVWHIANDKPPGDMAMNTSDIMALYPDLTDDFVLISGEERDQAVEIAGAFSMAQKQLKRWKDKETDAKDAMAVLLRDRPELRDAEGIIAKWGITKGSESVLKLSAIKKEHPLVYRYLQRKEMLSTSSGSRSVKIKRKGE